jgi:hypothetical protein
VAVFNNRVAQPVRIHTAGTIVDGHLTVGLGHRTLDELNLGSRPMLVLHEPAVQAGSMALAGGAIGISKGAILMGLEIPMIGAPLARQGHEEAPLRTARALVRLHMATGISVEGSIVASPGTDIMNRLNRTGRRFIAVTAAILRGPDLEGVAPFVAVNMGHVLAVEVLLAIEAAPEETAEEGAYGVAAAR